MSQTILKFEMATDVFQAYAFYTGILLVKMLVMSFITALARFLKCTFANPEDTFMFNFITGKLLQCSPVPIPAEKVKAKVTYDDPDVERTRRAHLNDLENILPYFIIALLYCFTNPDLSTATLLFKTFTYARIAHTLVYAVCPLPQPSRGLAWIIGQACTAYMTIEVITHFY